MQYVLTEFADRVRPGHTALVEVDIQNDFCAAEGYGGKVLGRDVSNNVPMAEANIALVDAARSCGALVIWVQAIFDTKYLSAPVLAKKAERQRTGELCVDGTWGADFFIVDKVISPTWTVNGVKVGQRMTGKAEAVTVQPIKSMGDRDLRHPHSANHGVSHLCTRDGSAEVISGLNAGFQRFAKSVPFSDGRNGHFKLRFLVFLDAEDTFGALIGFFALVHNY